LKEYAQQDCLLITLYTILTRTSSYYSLRMTHLVTRGHFRSRDKDGGHTVGSAIHEKPMIHANLVALSFTEPEL